jgi:hypothetical protein
MALRAKTCAGKQGLGWGLPGRAAGAGQGGDERRGGRHARRRSCAQAAAAAAAAAQQAAAGLDSGLTVLSECTPLSVRLARLKLTLLKSPKFESEMRPAL